LVQSALDAAATLDATFPDNVNFDSGDADLWEYRYGIPYNPASTLQQRMNNLYQEMQYQDIQGPENPFYIQSILQAYGFNVKIYQNIFFDGDGNLYQKTPSEILGTVTTTTQLRFITPQTQLGAQTQLGGVSYQFIANSENPETYSTGGILWPTFFIAGNTINSVATIPLSRQTELRRLVLKLKPAYTVAFLIVNFV
ncbi:MAG TPA: hypothetical protein VK890_05010, partial [Bacteroidia bacterium]|nr:hypothetical protein [Bacteroidia bacterium]